jgi:hypothetical protein
MYDRTQMEQAAFALIGDWNDEVIATAWCQVMTRPEIRDVG